jgi:hypothetical protein
MSTLGARLRNLWGEPVLVWGAIQAGTAMAESFGWLGGIGIHGQHALAVLLLVENAVAAVHVALVTHRTLMAPVIELFKALGTLSAVYGFHMSTEQTGIAVTFITALFAFGHQSQTSPIPPPPLDVSPPPVNPAV